jgi:hypothetical protein
MKRQLHGQSCPELIYSIYMISSVVRRIYVLAVIALTASAALASVQTTCHNPVTSPDGLTFDGANVFVASGSGSVVAIDAATWYSK